MLSANNDYRGVASAFKGPKACRANQQVDRLGSSRSVGRGRPWSVAVSRPRWRNGAADRAMRNRANCSSATVVTGAALSRGSTRQVWPLSGPRPGAGGARLTSAMSWRSRASVGQRVVVFAGGRRLDAVALIGPSAQVNAATALAAKRPPRIFGCKYRGPAAGRAGHAAGLGWGGQAHAQSVNSNGMSTAAGRSRPSVSARISRTDTCSRWPVISGTRPSVSAMRTRSSW